MGEYLVGAYLKLICNCDFVEYNVRPPELGLKGLQEFDIIGLNLKTKTTYICEATTHIQGVLYGSYENTVKKIKQKYLNQKSYAKNHLGEFKYFHYMFWSPRVPIGKLSKALMEIDGLELIINENYTNKVDQLKQKAKVIKKDIGNPFFRTLQILAHLRR